MGYFEQFPYTNFHELNLDWLLSQMKALGSAFDAFVETNVLKYSDPIDWSIGTQYEANTIVRNGEDVYLSKQAVPAGVAITNTDYWFKVGDLSTYQLQLDLIRHQIAADDEGTNVNASQSYAAGAVFWLNSYLSRATQTIAAGAPFVLGDNYERVTVIDLLEDLTGTVSSLQTRVETVEDRMALQAGLRKRIVCIGDSIAGGYNPDGNVTGWPEQLRQKLGLSAGSTYFEKDLGGSGFTASYSGSSFLDLLTELTPAVTDKETITDVYIIGGVNDAQAGTATVAGIKNAVTALCEYCRTNYPNAAVHVGCIAYYRTGNANRATVLRNIHEGCSEGCTGSARIIPNLIGPMSIYSNYASDGLHVTGACEAQLAECILSENGLSITVPNEFTPVSGVSSVPNPVTRIEKDLIHYWLGYTAVNFTGDVINGAGQTVKIGNMVNSGILGLGYGSATSNFHIINFSGTAHIRSGNYVPCHGYLSFYNGEIYLHVRALNTAGSNWAGYLYNLIIETVAGSLPIV